MYVRLKTYHFCMLSILSIVISKSLSKTHPPRTSLNINYWPVESDNETEQRPYIQHQDKQVQPHEIHQSPVVEITFRDHTEKLKPSNKSSSFRIRCRRAENDLDTCSAQLLTLGFKEATLPDNIEQLDSEYCPNFKKLVNCIKLSTDCYPPFERQIIK